MARKTITMTLSVPLSLDFQVEEEAKRRYCSKASLYRLGVQELIRKAAEEKKKDGDHH